MCSIPSKIVEPFAALLIIMSRLQPWISQAMLTFEHSQMKMKDSILG